MIPQQERHDVKSDLSLSKLNTREGKIDSNFAGLWEVTSTARQTQRKGRKGLSHLGGYSEEESEERIQ
jgi:hypothetical protein